jgi:hypothetical protein
MTEISEASFEHPSNLTVMTQLGLIDSTTPAVNALAVWRALITDAIVRERRRAIRDPKYQAVIPGYASRAVVEAMTKTERAALCERLMARRRTPATK